MEGNNMTKLEQSLKDRDLIDIGDKVLVNVNQYSFNGIVKYKACQSGDCWIFEETNSYYIPNGNIHYVQTFEEIVKYKEVDKKDIPF
jgi:hypothetical protein